MNLRGKPRASWILLLNPPRLRPRHCSCCGRPARCAHMGAYSCTIGHHRCHVWVLGELFEHGGPNSVLFPACEAFEDAVPLVIPVWQFTPLGAGAQNPVNCLNETATLLLLPCVGTRVSLQKRVKFLPLIVGNFSCRHPTIVANVSECIKCQRDLVNSGEWGLMLVGKEHFPGHRHLRVYASFVAILNRRVRKKVKILVNLLSDNGNSPQQRLSVVFAAQIVIVPDTICTVLNLYSSQCLTQT